MPVRATIAPLPEPGHALLRVSELDAAPEGLTLSIQRQQGPETHLADDGWRRTETWLLPDEVSRNGDVLEFHLGPEICDRLAGIATVRLRVREPDIGVVGTTVVAWPAMLTSGAAGASGTYDDTVRLRRRQQAAPPSPPELPPPLEIPPEPPPPPPPRPELRAARDPMADMPKRSGATGWMIAAVLVLLAVGGGYYYWTNHLHPPEPVVAAAPPPAPTPLQPAASQPPAKSVRETVAEYFATKPAPDAMLAKAQEFAKAGDVSAAFLVYRHAAEQGSAAAQLELAAFYDPTQPPRAGFPHDGTQAADWYERAALTGLAEAQRKLGLLLAKGGSGLSADVTKAKVWLQQAAAQNDAEAKKALDGLPK
jgi:hypothetical protein